MIISPEYAEELGRQIDELEAENERLREFSTAQAEQVPAGYQFRQRSGVGKGPQTSAPWCDWCAIDRETYEKYRREPNKLVQVRPVYAAQPQAASIETEASIIAERLRTLAACEDELSHDFASQWLRDAASFIQTTQAAQRASTAPVEPYAWVIPGDDQSRPSGSIDAMAWREGEFTKPLYAQPSPAPVETAKHSPDECGRECQYYDYFEMLWNWFADESRRGAEDMRANAANGGLSADDFKGMLDDHEANLIPVPPQAVQVTNAMCEAAVKADQAERIQGFTYEAHHVIRDVWKDFSEQKVWEIDKNDADAEPKFRHQCRIERMRKVLEAALEVTRPEEK